MFFFSADGGEPPHVHVEREASTAKFWLKPVRLCRCEGFGRHELQRIENSRGERNALIGIVE
jgi:hypothetical protein